MSLHVPCPNCGADVVFRSPALPNRVCDYCHTMLVRSDSGVARVGEAAALPFDVSPVQIGMRGRVDDKAFEVIGRVRWAWSDGEWVSGAWNEWLLLFDDNSNAWLGEAMGQFMLLWGQPIGKVRSRAIREVMNGKDAIPGTEVQIDNQKLVISDARAVRCVAAEGELPFTAAAGWTLYSVDLRGRSGECATIQRDAGEATYYLGRYVTLAELAPRGLRRIEGWTLPSYAA
jgi:ribosomal protein S27E